MTIPNEKQEQTKKQLKRSVASSLLLALLVGVFPLFYILEYRNLGFIYTGKTRTVTASGDEALLIMYGTAVAALCAFVIAVYSAAASIKKIRRGEYSEVDEAPEFVICRHCKTPQYSKELVSGTCAKCSGDVESLKGYYDRHPEQRNGSQHKGSPNEAAADGLR